MTVIHFFFFKEVLQNISIWSLIDLSEIVPYSKEPLGMNQLANNFDP